MFDKNKENRTISLNSHYLVLFKNPRDATQIVNLAKQMYPGQNRFLKEAYSDATSRPYGYLLIDLKQNTPDSIRIRTNIFPDETCAVYVPKKALKRLNSAFGFILPLAFRTSAAQVFLLLRYHAE